MSMMQKGFSLIELLIALLLGSVLLAMVIGLYVTGVSTGAKSLKYSRLRTDLQSIISVMETDIRRAGYGGSVFMVGSGAQKTLDTISSVSQNCIVYYYNHNSAAVITGTNKMAFRFDSANNTIQFGTGVAPLATDCYSSGYWAALSDPGFIKITSLKFTESVAPHGEATMRSVQIALTGELASDSEYSHAINTRVQVRNLEFN